MNKIMLTREYELSHGHAPRGCGAWGFAPRGQRDNIDAWFWVYNVTYGEAKKKLPAGTWIVLP